MAQANHQFSRPTETRTSQRSIPSYAALVDRIVREPPPNLQALCPDVHGSALSANWLRAVEFASQAFRSIYTCISLRSGNTEDPDQPRLTPPHLATARSFIYDLAGQYLNNTAIKYLKWQLSVLFARAARQTEVTPRPKELDAVPDSRRPLIPAQAEWRHVSEYKEGILGPGFLYEICQRVLRSGSNPIDPSSFEFLLAYDLLNAKSGMDPAPDSFVEAALRDHRAALSRPTPIDAACDSQGVPIMMQVETFTRAFCHMVFHGVVVDQQDGLPSSSASFDTKRSEGGALGGILKEYKEYVDSEPRAPSFEAATAVPVLQRDKTVVRRYDFDLSQDTVILKADEDGSKDLSSCAPECVLPLNLPEIEADLAHLRAFRDSRSDVELSTGLDVAPCPILEPLKVRMITKGPKYTYWRALGLQKTLHTALKRCPAAQFIGKPIDDASFALRFSKATASLDADEILVSGDYKAATDNLNPDFVNMVVDVLCEELLCNQDQGDGSFEKVPIKGTIYEVLLRTCLLGHHVHYPKSLGLPDHILQTWGQLMGSPVSFPVLCIVNICTTATALGWGASYLFDPRCPLVVNGDDIGFLCKRDQYPRWQQFVKAAGLEPSIGKNYTSQDFLIMNSELRVRPSFKDVTYEDDPEFIGPKTESHALSPFVFLPEDSYQMWSEAQRGRVCILDPMGEFLFRDTLAQSSKQMTLCSFYNLRWPVVPFINLPLLLGREKKGVDAGKDIRPSLHPLDLSARAKDLLAGFAGPTADAILTVFLRRHEQVLKRAPGNISWWMPQHLGGLGLPCLRPFDASRITSDQHRLATYLLTLTPFQRTKLTRRPASKQQDWASVELQRLDDLLAGVLDHEPEVMSTRRNRDTKGVTGTSLMIGWLAHQIRRHGGQPTASRATLSEDTLLLKWRGVWTRLLKRSREITGALEKGNLHLCDLNVQLWSEEHLTIQHRSSSLNFKACSKLPLVVHLPEFLTQMEL